MSYPDYYTKEYTVDFTNSDCFGICKPSDLMLFMQDAATRDSANMHLSREELISNIGGFWMLVRLKYDISRPLYIGQAISVKTRFAGNKGPLFYREYVFSDEDKAIGRATSAWVIADVNSGKPFRPSDIEMCSEITFPIGSEVETLQKLSCSAKAFSSSQFTVPYSMLDINAHLNNAKTADVVCDAIHFEKMSGKYVSSMQICFLNQSFAGETLEIKCAKSRDNEQYVEGGADGAVHFNAAVTLSDI